MGEKICRLCLQTFSNNKCPTIGESLVKTLKLNLKISKETVMCDECASCLQVFSKFTPGVYVGDAALPSSDHQNYIKSEPIKIEATSTSDLQSLIKTETKCSFCTETHGREDLIPLNGSKENEFLVTMLEQYISKMNPKRTEGLLTCGTCLDALRGILSFVLKCLEVEEKITRYIELQGADDEGQVELKHVQQYVFRPILKLENASFGVNDSEDRCDQIREGFTTMAESAIKREPETHQTDYEINDIKLEQTDCAGFQEPFIENKIPSTTQKFRCKLCSYEAKRKFTLNRHLLTHKSLSEVNTFKCELCLYETIYISTYKRHLLTHKSHSEITTFKCESCPYEAKYKSCLKIHLLTHKSLSEVKMFKCELCSHETKRSSHLRVHLLTHKSPSEIKMYKCGVCSYEAKRKSHLTDHLKTHKSSSEVRMFKCALCSYGAVRKATLKRHVLTHKGPVEIKSFK